MQLFSLLYSQLYPLFNSSIAPNTENPLEFELKDNFSTPNIPPNLVIDSHLSISSLLAILQSQKQKKMNSFSRRYVKHATLVEGCFPAEKSSETTPNSNELSYLVYYAQSKPAKLTKVGAYLSKRIAKDTYKLRRTDVLVGLHIYNALLAACGRDLYFFAKDVLGSLETVLAANDFEFAKAATHTFALFCRSHSGATLAIDKGLRSLYTNLITTFAGYARAKVEDPQTGKRLHWGCVPFRPLQRARRPMPLIITTSCPA
ncbi:hypothetical protein BX661DRAFT_66106 [Kickxella alabastrina]|uniref:uncharacterized protein n=1 Tax=Kickxella alabastrina TaxID=61397 RepID=UPI00221FB718|nr:uncharacterized protein BX661DRAFT_66106 [Kickxella alabastrina]KAI7833850.1 hypothetical protein BX661DRAFT_66106 [Kickxella alabastrina]